MANAPYAFVTLVTSDYYLPGALAVAASLKDLHPSPPTPPEVPFQTLCLVTPESVDVSSIKLLRRTFDVVIGVEIIEQDDDKGLQLLGRPDLNLVLTKLHIFRLTQYAKLIFLDADVLPVRPMSHLFTLPHEFAAVPDVGWPDIFNSGVLVFTPGEEKFNELRELLKSKGSWDGGDQGILNEWRGNDWHRLSFTYNTTPTAVYTYAPAYERYGSQISAIHFIGPNKPWASVTYRPPGVKYSQLSDKSLNAQAPSYDYDSLVDRWYEVYDRHYRSQDHPQHGNFEFTRYDSVWDTGSAFGVGAEMAAPPSATVPGAALGLDDLRKIAVEGMSSYSAAAQEAPRIGEYRSMPLEGRVDLMRPRREPPLKEDAGQSADSQDQGGDQNLTPKQPFTVMTGGDVPRMETLPTPLPHELPPAPYHRALDLPPSAPSTPYQQGQLYTEQQDTAQQQDAGSYFSSEDVPVPPAGMHWAPHRFVAQDRAYYQESEQSDDQGSAIAQWQPPRKAQDAQHSGGQTTWSPGERDRHHNLRDPYRAVHPSVNANHVRHGHQSPRGSAAHTPRGHLSPRGVHSPRGHHSPTQARHSPPPGPPHGSEQPYFPPHHHHHHAHQSQQTQTFQAQHAPQSQDVHQQHHAQYDQLWPQQAPQPQRAAQHSHSPHAQDQQPQQAQHPSAPQRPSTPPKLEWNPAVEPPPKTPPPPTTFPSDTYFPNIWDQAPSREHDAAFQTFPGHSPGSTETFFHPPPSSRIPEQLLREGQYENVIGKPVESSPGSPPVPPTPDRSKVRAIFPWEEKPRHAPRRVFPVSESPPPVANFVDEPAPPPQVTQEPDSAVAQQVQTPPSSVGLPYNFTFTNAWDTVPSIQRYASKLVRPHYSVFQPPTIEYDAGWRRWDQERERVYQEKQDASSMDGDDEDEGDDDEDNRGQPARYESDGGRERTQHRSRAGSLTNGGGGGKGKKYRARGVQTTPIETRSMGVQVNIWAEEVEAARKGKDPKPSRGTGVGIRQWPALPTGAGLLPSVTFKVDPDQMAVGTPTVAQPLHSSVVPFPGKASPTGLRSPQTLGSPRTYSPPIVQSPGRVSSPPKIPSPKPLSPTKASSPKRPSSPRAVMSPRRLSGAQIATSKLAGSPQFPESPSSALGPSASSSPRSSPKLTKLSSPVLHRMSSNDTMATSSPSTSGPVETPEGTPIMGPVRKGGRVWDPARGVDVFKRSSEEVLARFLRSGSFDEEDGQRRHV
ncbi:hypothetical protein L227DRAFT_579376 [Lentinus tigrinus ALCF2SS1-6]|uniref:glycogenin glucosyltransferase n=1 Tax=Lentinus tigrinus ALCF2SS1-6 TaxID=1328759 RepID=A0A5C2RY01_9APHY|nr:hypothetical protein L227DRAFT_579376 [Lentinus tigrinus ALCF2SS1-6]